MPAEGCTTGQTTHHSTNRLRGMDSGLGRHVGVSSGLPNKTSRDKPGSNLNQIVIHSACIFMRRLSHRDEYSCDRLARFLR
jgi:hypothetical protein